MWMHKSGIDNRLMPWMSVVNVLTVKGYERAELPVNRQSGVDSSNGTYRGCNSPHAKAIILNQ